MITVITYGGVFSNVFSNHYGFIIKVENTPLLAITNHCFKLVMLYYSSYMPG